MARDDVVRSLDDLKDERSRNIFRTYGLDMGDIAPFYRQMLERPEIDVPSGVIDSQSPLIKKLACVAIVSYELVHRKVVSFPAGRKSYLGGLFSREIVGTTVRTASAPVYEAQGKFCSGILHMLTTESPTSSS